MWRDGPIRGQYQDHVITLDQSERLLSKEWGLVWHVTRLWVLLLCRVSAPSHVMTSRVTNVTWPCHVCLCSLQEMLVAALFDVRALLAPASCAPGDWLLDMNSGQNKTIKIRLIKILCGCWELEKLCRANTCFYLRDNWANSACRCFLLSVLIAYQEATGPLSVNLNPTANTYSFSVTIGTLEMEEVL